MLIAQHNSKLIQLMVTKTRKHLVYNIYSKPLVKQIYHSTVALLFQHYFAYYCRNPNLPPYAGAVSQNSSRLLLSCPSVNGISLFHFGISFFKG